jgi:8-oxo-dGTP pyrophosphatase MutT (NUDIX family)
MTGFNEFIGDLRIKLGKPLPGLESQLKMAGARRMIRDGKVIIPKDARKSAVLILFYPLNGKVNLVFIKRTEYPGVHSGQVSFPGGAWEQEDKDLEYTALREAKEEIGIDPAKVVTIGKLTDLFIPPSNFLVTPIVGYCTEHPDFIADPEEVDRILEVSADQFFHKETKQAREITVYPDLHFEVPCFYIDGIIIWGATAMMMHEMLDVINPGA